MEGNIAYDYNLQSLLINGMLHMGFELLLLWFCVLLVVFAALPTPVDIGALFEVVVEFFAVFDWACTAPAEAIDAKTSPIVTRINVLAIHIDVLFPSIENGNIKVLLNSFI